MSQATPATAAAPPANGNANAQGKARGNRRGIVLIAVLIVIVLLTLAAYQYADMMTAEYKATENATRYVQAQLIARSGVHYVAGLLADPSAINGSLYDNDQQFKGIQVGSSDSPRYRGKFWIVSPPSDPTAATPLSGLTDEGGKININAMMRLDPTGKTLYQLLLKLPNMTPDIANAIVDWLDPDDTPRQASDGGTLGGAESDYYLSLSPPYKCKNGPIDSLEELLLVRGVTPLLLFGNDTNKNGMQDNDDSLGDGTFDRGWSAYLTVYSRETNVSSTGTTRFYLNDTNTQTLYTNLQDAVGSDLATYILLARQYTPTSNSTAKAGGGGGTGGGTGGTGGTTNNYTTGSLSSITTSTLKLTDGTSSSSGTTTKGGGSSGSGKTIASLYDLVDSYIEIPATNPKNKATRYFSPITKDNAADLMSKLFDTCTIYKDQEVNGRININTCPQAVLQSLPGLSDTDISNIMGARQNAMIDTDPAFQSPAWLMTQCNISAATMKNLEKLITTRTQVYRFQVVGWLESGGPIVRLECVIDANGGYPRILYLRDISELGKGYDIEEAQ
jgi:type II secretory pathway component PulK